MINWTLKVEDFEDVACAEDDMEATDPSQSLCQRGWCEGRGIQEYKGRNGHRKNYGIFWTRCPAHCPDSRSRQENPTAVTAQTVTGSQTTELYSSSVCKLQFCIIAVFRSVGISDATRLFDTFEHRKYLDFISMNTHQINKFS